MEELVRHAPDRGAEPSGPARADYEQIRVGIARHLGEHRGGTPLLRDVLNIATPFGHDVARGAQDLLCALLETPTRSSKNSYDLISDGTRYPFTTVIRDPSSASSHAR